jgi:hypothetical protein
MESSMRYNRTFNVFGFVVTAITAGVMLAALAAPALAGTSDTPGAYLGCHSYIVCVINGHIVTGDAQKACNNGKVETITQCPKKAKH